MKTCPRCNRTYPDSENFCEADSSALVSSPAFTQQTASDHIECPVCGGKAEPGEIICNFCGARLDQSQPPLSPTPLPSASPPPRSPSPYPRLSSAPTTTQPPPTSKMQGPIEPDDGGSRLGLIGYVLAAIIALAAGAWFAIHLSAGKTEQAAGTSSPAAGTSPSTVVGGTTVTLANAMPVQVSGPGASSPDRSVDVIRKAFDDNRGSLVDTYNNALASDPKVADGMLIRLHILADGSIENSAVRTSTAADPAMDAKVVGAMAMWKLAATGAGDVYADYPIIFAHDSGEESRLESDLQTKVANLSPTEPSEYASGAASEATPVAASSAEASGGPSPGLAAGSAPSPEAAPTTAAAPPVVAKPRHKSHPKVAHAAPTPSLFEQVKSRLKANPKLRRVNAYTTGGTVTLFGKVFGESEKSLAEETVRNIPGVTSVVDTITTDEAEWAAEQSNISRQLANAGLGKVTVKVIGHDAFLDGEVKTDLEKTRAVTLAEGAAPVTVRENLIRVVPGSMFSF